MSIPVPLERLREALAERGAHAYLLTGARTTRVRMRCISPLRWEGDALVVAGAGKRTTTNAAARPGVSLLAPVRAADDYSLIIDGTARVVDGGEVRAS